MNKIKYNEFFFNSGLIYPKDQILKMFDLGSKKF